MSPAVVRVLPDVPALDRTFDYDATSADPPLRVGDRVRVPLHGRTVRGWVLDVEDLERGDLDLKPVGARLGRGPSRDVIELCAWAAWRWAGPRCKLLATASPERIVTTLPVVPASAAPDVHNQARVSGARLVRHRTSTLLRVGPCTDPLDLVLGMLRGVTDADLGGTLVVLTPTTGWAERLAARLARRGIAAAGPDRWAEARAGFPVVVGARAAALSPVPQLAAALVLDAHDGAFRQTQTPCWNAVPLLAERCRRDEVSLVATSWCPSPAVSSLFSATEVAEHEARFWPRLVVADLRAADPREGALTSSFAGAAHHALDERGHGPKVVVVLQRLGGVRLLACRSCGSLAVCEPHHEPLSEVDGALTCSRGCAQHPRVCVTCGTGPLRAVREGIGSLTKRVSALLQVEATEVSAATSSIDPSAQVLVGTEAVLNRVRAARLVCFADLDDYLAAPRAHSSLDALRAIGLAGRLVGARGSDSPGHVLVQTRQPDHRAVVAAVHGNPEVVLSDEHALSRSLQLAPFRALCALHGEGAAALATSLRAEHLDVHPDGDGFVVVAETHAQLCDALARVDRPSAPVRVDVDPPDR